MSHIQHLSKNKINLELRFQILRLIREWFWEQGFTEIEAPIIVKLPGQEPNLTPMKINIHDEHNQEYNGYLHTSPEYTMKKMLVAGRFGGLTASWDKIFYLGKCFRDQESFGGTHNPEFTMLEWYRVNEDMFGLMEDIEVMINYIIQKLNKNFTNIKQILNKYLIVTDDQSLITSQKLKFRRVKMKDLWKKIVGVNLDDYLTTEKMLELSQERGWGGKPSERYEELFYRIFLNEIEPKLKGMGPVFIYNYPAQMAALSKLSKDNPGYAERFEAYVDGLELANVYSELTNVEEQKKRLLAEVAERKSIGKDVFEIDKDFMEALEIGLPESSGGALGVDRLVMWLRGCQNIDDVITLPASKLFDV